MKRRLERKRFPRKKKQKRRRRRRSEKGKEEQEQPVIRVLLKTGGYTDEVHPNVAVSAGGGLLLEGAGGKREAKEGETVTIAPDDPLFEGGTIRVKTKKREIRLRFPV